MKKTALSEETIRWLIASIIERAAETAEKYGDNPTDFSQGLMEGYYEVLDMLKSRLFVNDADLSNFGIDFDLEALEAKLKRKEIPATPRPSKTQ